MCERDSQICCSRTVFADDFILTTSQFNLRVLVSDVLFYILSVYHTQRLQLAYGYASKNLFVVVCASHFQTHRLLLGPARPDLKSEDEIQKAANHYRIAVSAMLFLCKRIINAIFCISPMTNLSINCHFR